VARAIPLRDSRAQFARIAGEVTARAGEVLASGTYMNGAEVHGFESEFATYCGVTHVIGVASGTDALRLALGAVGAGPGDEVITASHGFIDTAEAIVHVGATPRFVDVEPATGNIDHSKLEAAVTERTIAVVPVHLYGRPAEMDTIMEIAGRYGLAVIENASEAHGARYKGETVGSLGDLACFSFSPNKNLGAYGDGGAVTTDSFELAAKVRLLAQHGSTADGIHSVIGWNSRLDELQAAVLRIKLVHLDEENRCRQAVAEIYRELLEDLPGVDLPLHDAHPGNQSANHRFVVRCAGREAVRSALAAEGIATGCHYAVPIHMQPAFTDRCGAPPLKTTESWAASCLSLPMFPELSRADIQRVAGALRAVIQPQAH